MSEQASNPWAAPPSEAAAAPASNPWAGGSAETPAASESNPWSSPADGAAAPPTDGVAAPVDGGDWLGQAPTQAADTPFDVVHPSTKP